MVIDDEPLAVSLISDYIRKTDALSLQASFTDPIQGLHAIQQSPPDLLFLDVQMPELNGIQVMKILRQEVLVILTTAYDQFALEGFEQEAVDYLLKPISYARFLVGVRKARERRAPLPAAASNTERDFIFVKSEYKTLKIKLSEIRYLEGLGDYVAIHHAEGKTLSLEKMGHYADILPTGQFMRVHRSYIVALGQINYIERNRIVIGDARIPISDSYKKAFWEEVRKGS